MLEQMFVAAGRPLIVDHQVRLETQGQAEVHVAHPAWHPAARSAGSNAPPSAWIRAIYAVSRVRLRPAVSGSRRMGKVLQNGVPHRQIGLLGTFKVRPRRPVHTPAVGRALELDRAVIPSAPTLDDDGMCAPSASSCQRWSSWKPPYSRQMTVDAAVTAPAVDLELQPLDAIDIGPPPEKHSSAHSRRSAGPVTRCRGVAPFMVRRAGSASTKARSPTEGQRSKKVCSGVAQIHAQKSKAYCVSREFLFTRHAVVGNQAASSDSSTATGTWSQRLPGPDMFIDHLMLSPEAADRLSSASIDKHVRAWEKPSDHVPVAVELSLEAA